MKGASQPRNLPTKNLSEYTEYRVTFAFSRKRGRNLQNVSASTDQETFSRKRGRNLSEYTEYRVTFAFSRKRGGTFRLPC